MPPAEAAWSFVVLELPSCNDAVSQSSFFCPSPENGLVFYTRPVALFAPCILGNLRRSARRGCDKRMTCGVSWSRGVVEVVDACMRFVLGKIEDYVSQKKKRMRLNVWKTAGIAGRAGVVVAVGSIGNCDGRGGWDGLNPIKNRVRGWDERPLPPHHVPLSPCMCDVAHHLIRDWLRCLN